MADYILPGFLAFLNNSIVRTMTKRNIRIYSVSVSCIIIEFIPQLIYILQENSLSKNYFAIKTSLVAIDINKKKSDVNLKKY